MKSSVFSRSFELARLATKLGWTELKSKDPRSRIAQAKLITESLSQLKGAAMKAGQLLSLEIDDYFPPEAIEILSVLQKQATAHPTEEMQQILKVELGPERYQKIKDFSNQPVACASIGQVHRAVIEGQSVALKIQYPQVAGSVDSDLKILRKFAETLCFIFGRSIDLKPLFKEFREVLTQELDYVREREFLTRYKTKLAEINATSDFQYFSPSPLSDYSTSKVLTMSWEDGVDLRTWIRDYKDPASREEIGNAVLNLYCHEFFQWGLVQTDPNFANFLVRQKSRGQRSLVLLDFGATKEYDKEFISNYTNLLRLVDRKDHKGLVEKAIQFGFLDVRESQTTRDLFIELMETAAEPFRISPKKFNFSDKDYAKKTQDVVRRFGTSVKFTPPPYKIIFLHRKLGGIFSLLKHLEVELDAGPYWHQMLNTKER
jgi:aarF domain-containing kinase